MKKLINSITVAHLLRAAFSLILIFIAVQLMTPLARSQRQIAAQQSLALPSAPEGTCSWTAGHDMPTPTVRAAGVYFPRNGKFYAMGGSTSDSVGSDLVHPYEYDPVTGWTTKAASYPDNQVNDMACGVLTDGTTPYIYCIGGSAAGETTATNRVFRYNPVTDSIAVVAAPWIGNTDEMTLPGGFAVLNNRFYILGGFHINTSMDNRIWEFTIHNNPPWVQKSATLSPSLGYIPTATVGCLIYMAGGSTWDGSTLQDSNNSFVFDPMGNTVNPISMIPRQTAETRALNYHGQVWVLGGGRPNPSNEVDIYDGVTWTTGLSFNTPRRNFAADTDGNKIWLAGGYAADGVTPLDSMEIYSCTAPIVVSAVSRRTHEGVGDFDIDLPLTGTPGIESRLGVPAGGNTMEYTMVVTFADNVTVTGSPQAEVICGTGSITAVTPMTDHTVRIVLSVPPLLPLCSRDQTIVVRLNAVNGTTDFTIPMTIVIADVNANGHVDSIDKVLVKIHQGETVNETNFRFDVNGLGNINSSDLALTKIYDGCGVW